MDFQGTRGPTDSSTGSWGPLPAAFACSGCPQTDSVRTVDGSYAPCLSRHTKKAEIKYIAPANVLRWVGRA
jgi:hypothetical protein